MAMADHTPVLGWLIDGLRYIISLTTHAEVSNVQGVTNGLNGFNTILSRWIDENAPMTPDQCDRLVDLSIRLGEVAEQRRLLHEASVNAELLRLLWAAEKADRIVNQSSRQNSLLRLRAILGLPPNSSPE